MVKILAVYDADPAFGERLADYVNQKEKIPFTAMAFSSLDRLREYGKEHPIEILLVDECSRALVGDVKAEQVMVLCDGELVDGLDAFASIYKYQSGDCIMREVLASYCSRPVEPALALLGSRALVMGIYSPVNRCFKSSLALTIGQVVAKREAVLYLNLEEYSGFTRLINSEYKADLSDVLYLYRQGGYNWMKLKSMISNWGNMDYIPPVRYAEDLSQVAPEDMAQLIDRSWCCVTGNWWMGWMHLHPSTSTSPGTASCVRCWHPTAAALWSRRWPFWDPGPWLWEYILL